MWSCKRNKKQKLFLTGHGLVVWYTVTVSPSEVGTPSSVSRVLWSFFLIRYFSIVVLLNTEKDRVHHILPLLKSTWI